MGKIEGRVQDSMREQEEFFFTILRGCCGGDRGRRWSDMDYLSSSSQL